ncbi:MAG TPA: GNAT family N-acetyltransferase [Devosiaceae bacterium]|jgi:CelD/BcsL family acetyltransferase involved in cellulose biosynthesis|nr:GNAT family N-acetyltransferase [Devosiaceae bacterium]
MAEGSVLGGAGAEAELLPVAAAAAVGDIAPAIVVSRRIEDVAPAWQQFEADGVLSPGQSYAFTRLWVATQRVPEQDQLYIVAELGGVAIALLPLRRRKVGGIAVLSWFPGCHVGCNAPLVDPARLARLGPDGRRRLWQRMLAAADADLLHLPAVPVCEVDGNDIFAELGTTIAGDTLYRAAFGSWEEANSTQRNKSRRKHDRQQGERLEALGAVTFEELAPGAEAGAVLERMFRQRAERFRRLGIADPFVGDVRRFYDATVTPDSGLPVRLHVLRLDGAVVAVRYNIVIGDRMFCLISSMSEDAAIQGGSPGKQCLLRVMQKVFDEGIRVFDMGAGFTDEKRHWCNLQLPLRQHYLALSMRGAVAGWLHRNWQVQRLRIKTNPTLLRLVKSLRSAAPALARGAR